ncbi:MAG: N-acetylmuramoyl-L-alanine amidase [Ruminococcus sp.]
MTITNQYLTHNRPYTKRSCTDAIAMHWVANPGTSAMANRNYFQNTSTEVSANYIIGLVGEVICCIPDNEVSWCTNQANGYTVSIECCHPDWTGRFNGATYKSMVELAASLCRNTGYIR